MPKTDELPEYLEHHEMNALLNAAQDPRHKLLILLGWRAGLRVSESLALEPRDLRLDGEHPTLRVRQGKGKKSREVPVHRDLRDALSVMLAYGVRRNESVVGTRSRKTAWRWVKRAVAICEASGALEPGRKIATHTLRHSFARHMLMHGVPINHLSAWLGHSELASTLIYLRVLPDPSGMIDSVP